MTDTTRYRIINFIKEKIEFSIPMIQNDLEIEYGEIRNVISDLEDEKKIEFLEGIVYKWVVNDEEEGDDDNDDDGDDDLTPFERLFARRQEHRPPSFLFDNSDESDEDTSDSKDDDNNIFKSLFDDPSDLDNFVDSVFKNESEVTDFIDSISDETKSKLLEPNGGPLPDLNEDTVSIHKFIAPYNFKRDDIDVEDNAFPHAVKMIIPDIDEPFHIFRGGDDENHHFHDNGVVVKYIRHKAKDLDAITKYKWIELIKKCSRDICESGHFDGDIYKLPVPEIDDYKSFRSALATFTTEVLNIIYYVNATLERNSINSLFIDLHNNIASRHEEIGEKIIESYDNIDTLTDYLDKIVEICPEANSKTAIRVAIKVPLVAIKLRHPKRREIARFFNDISCENETSVIVYFIMKKINDIVKPEESEE